MMTSVLIRGGLEISSRGRPMVRQSRMMLFGGEGRDQKLKSASGHWQLAKAENWILPWSL